MLRGDRLVQEGPIQARRRQKSPLDVALKTLTIGVGLTLFTFPLLSAPPTRELVGSTTPTLSPTKEVPKVSGAPTIQDLLDENFRPGNPFGESILQARNPLNGNYDLYPELCSTYGGPEAYGVVKAPVLNVRSTANEESPVITQLREGTLLAYRLRLVMTKIGSRVSKVLTLLESGKHLNTAAAINGGVELIKNNPGTKCEPIQFSRQS